MPDFPEFTPEPKPPVCEECGEGIDAGEKLCEACIKAQREERRCPECGCFCDGSCDEAVAAECADRDYDDYVDAHVLELD